MALLTIGPLLLAFHLLNSLSASRAALLMDSFGFGFRRDSAHGGSSEWLNSLF